MDLEKLIKKYPNVSRVEIEKIRQKAPYLIYNKDCIVSVVESLDADRECEKANGKECITAGPLVQLLSVHFLPSDNYELIDQNKPLNIYGRIYAEFRDTNSGEMTVYDLYSRKFDDAQVLGPSGGPLALTGPVPGWPNEDCLPWNNNTRLVVDVFTGDEAKKLSAEKHFCYAEEDTTTDLEKVKLEYVHGELGSGSLALRYVSMPFAVYGDVQVEFFHRFLDEDLPSRFINIKGKIAARNGRSSSSEECCTTLFEKQSDNNEFERVEICTRRRGLGKMKLSRCWVGLPAYTSLVLDVDLSEFGTERKILKEMVELRIENDSDSVEDFFVDDDILVRVSLGCVSPRPQGKQQECGMELDDDDDDDDDESSDDEMLSGDEQMDEATCVPVASSLNLRRPWAHENRPSPTPSVEIFSIFIGRENYKKPLQVYGSILVSSDACKFYIFKRESKEDTFGLSEHSKTIPVLDGSRAYEESDSLEVKIDLKDVESCLHIKGYANWEYRYHESDSIRVDKQMCSVVQGNNGCFAAIHYTMFESAVQANVEFLCITNEKGGHVDDLVYPKVYGSLVAQYNNYEYTSRYNKDYYRIVLFKRNQEDSAQPGNDGLISLSRSMVVVPLNSSLLIEANIGNEFSKQPLPSIMFEFKIGDDRKSESIIKRND